MENISPTAIELNFTISNKQLEISPKVCSLPALNGMWELRILFPSLALVIVLCDTSCHLVLIILPKCKLQSLELLAFFQWVQRKGVFVFLEDSPQDLWEKLKAEMYLVSWRTVLKMIILFANETLLLDPGLHCVRDYLKLPCDFQKNATELSKQDLYSFFHVYLVERL